MNRESEVPKAVVTADFQHLPGFDFHHQTGGGERKKNNTKWGRGNARPIREGGMK